MSVASLDNMGEQKTRRAASDYIGVVLKTAKGDSCDVLQEALSRALELAETPY